MVSLVEVAKGIKSLIAGNEIIRRQVEENTGEIKELRKDVSKLREDLAELKSTVAKVDGKMDILISDHTTMVNVVKDVERLKVKVEALEGRR